MAHFLNLAWRNIQRNRRRSIITASAIVVGVTMMIVVNGMITGMLDRTIANSVELETGHIKIYPEGYHEKSDLLPTNMHLTYTDIITLLSGIPGIEGVSPRIKAGGMLQTEEESTRIIINGINPEDSKIRDLKSRIIKGDYLTGDNSIMIGETLADRLKIGLHDEVLLSSLASDGAPVSVMCTVEAVFNTGFSSYDSTMVFLSLTRAQALLNIGHEKATEIVIMVDNPDRIADVTASIVSELEKNNYTHDVLHWEGLAPELAQFAEMEKSMSFLFLSIVIIVAAIGILNTMLMAVYERVKEVGVMAAFGYKRRDILVLFVTEGLIIGLVGAVIGCILGLGINYYLSVAGMEFTGADVVEFMETRIYTRLTVSDVVYPFMFAVIIALVAALYPAYKASRLEPVEALRHV